MDSWFKSSEVMYTDGVETQINISSRASDLISRYRSLLERLADEEQESSEDEQTQEVADDNSY